MRADTKMAVLAFGLAVAMPGAGFAQTASPARDAAADAAQVQQIALTPALVEQFLAAKKQVEAVLDTLPEGTDQPDPATQAKLDAAAKANRFDDYKQYETVENNIGIVMAGMDSATKRYVGPEAVIRKQIADIQADKKISAKDKKDTVDQLDAAMATVPKLQYQGNVDVVAKSFDKLNEAMPQD